MAEGRRGLGRGLSALMNEAELAPAGEVRKPAGATEIPIELIRRNPDQPRREFEPAALQELADSIIERGVISPILIRPAPDTPGAYQIVAGERRWRAAQKAGLHLIPAIVRDFGELEMMEVALIENIQRADLNALEEARGYEAMMQRFGRSAEAIAKVVGKSRSHVANMLRLTRLPANVLAHLESGRLTAGHARALLDLDEAPQLADRIIAQGLNVRQAEALARQARVPPSPGRSRAAKPSHKDLDTHDLERVLSTALGLEVKITARGEGGELRVRYVKWEQLDWLSSRLMRGASK